MLPVVLVEARPLGRLLLFLAFVGMALDARHGNPAGMLLAVVCAVMLWGRPMLALGRGVVGFLAWSADRLRR